MSDDKHVYMGPGQDDVILCRLECCEHELSTDVTTGVLQAPFIVLDLRSSEQQAMPPRYLIIGGSGFVGAHLYSFLGQCRAVATFNSRLVEDAERINVASLRTMIDELVDHGITPVFASSDAVFDGSRGLWTKQDTANPMPMRPFMRTLAARSQEAYGGEEEACIEFLGDTLVLGRLLCRCRSLAC